MKLRRTQSSLLVRLCLTNSNCRLSIHFSGLFNGNEALANNMNLFLNENWKDILQELKKPITDGFGNIFATIINHIFNSFSYSDMFVQ